MQESNKQTKKRRASESDMAMREPRSVRQGALRQRKDVHLIETELQSINGCLTDQQARLVEAEDVMIRSACLIANF